jgi:drug/metabolite transporter (DMT)-like permease
MDRPAPADRPAALDRLGLFNLGLVYVIWGSTYLAIRIAVRPEGGFAPFHLALLRVLVASALLFAWAGLRRHRLRPTRAELIVLAGTGQLMWVGGNGLVTWAEQYADSGLAALLVASMPIWAALCEAVVDRRTPSLRMAGSLLIGFLGVGVLSWPVIRTGETSDLWAVVALLVAPLTWGVASVWLARRRPGLTVQAVSGWQHLLGGLGFVAVILLIGEPWSTPSGEAWLAWGYLTLFGSVIAFTAFVSALRLLPTPVVMTYTYANPVIAVFLGWLVIAEPVTGWTVTGAGLVLAGIAGVFQNRNN